MKKLWMIGQGIFILSVLALIFVLYPKTSASVNGNFINFDSKADYIMISTNPEFTNARYIEVTADRFSFELEPGTYYWKPVNGAISGFKDKFTIETQVALGTENDTLVNLGNVRLNVSKSKEGVMVGRIILEPSEGEKLENVDYTGRQDE